MMDKLAFTFALIAIVRCQVPPPSPSEATLTVTVGATADMVGSTLSSAQTRVSDPPPPTPTTAVDPSPPQTSDPGSQTAGDLKPLSPSALKKLWNLFNKRAPYDLSQGQSQGLAIETTPTPPVSMYGLPSGVNSLIPKKRRRPPLSNFLATPFLGNDVELRFSQLPHVRKHRFRRAELYHGNDPAAPHGDKGHWHPPKPPSVEALKTRQGRPPPPPTLFKTGSKSGSSRYSMPPESVLAQGQTELKGFTSKPASLETALHRVSQAEARNRYPSHFSEKTKKQDILIQQQQKKQQDSLTQQQQKKQQDIITQQQQDILTQQQQKKQQDILTQQQQKKQQDILTQQQQKKQQDILTQQQQQKKQQDILTQQQQKKQQDIITQQQQKKQQDILTHQQQQEQYQKHLQEHKRQQQELKQREQQRRQQEEQQHKQQQQQQKSIPAEPNHQPNVLPATDAHKTYPVSIYSEPEVKQQTQSLKPPNVYPKSHGPDVSAHSHGPKEVTHAYEERTANQPHIPSPNIQSKPPYQEVSQSDLPSPPQPYVQKKQQQQHVQQQHHHKPAPPASGKNAVMESQFITMFDSWFQERFGNKPQPTTYPPPTKPVPTHYSPPTKSPGRILILRNEKGNKAKVTRLGPSVQLKPVIPNPNAAVKPKIDIRERILKSRGHTPQTTGYTGAPITEKAPAAAGVDKKALFEDFMSMFKHGVGGPNHVQPSQVQNKEQYKTPKVNPGSSRGGTPVQYPTESSAAAGNRGKGQGQYVNEPNSESLGQGHGNEPIPHEPASEVGLATYSAVGPRSGPMHEPISEAGAQQYPNEANPTERISEVGPKATPSPKPTRRRQGPKKRPQTPAEAYFSGDPAYQPDTNPPKPVAPSTNSGAHPHPAPHATTNPKHPDAPHQPQPDPSAPKPEAPSKQPPPPQKTTSAPGKRGRSRPTPGANAPTEPTPSPRPVIDPDVLADINEARSYQGLPPLSPNQVDLAGNIKPMYRPRMGLFPNRQHPLRARRPPRRRRINNQHQQLHQGFHGNINPDLHRALHSLLRTKNNRRNRFGNRQQSFNSGMSFNPTIDPDLMSDLMDSNPGLFAGRNMASMTS